MVSDGTIYFYGLSVTCAVDGSDHIQLLGQAYVYTKKEVAHGILEEANFIGFYCSLDGHIHIILCHDPI